MPAGAELVRKSESRKFTFWHHTIDDPGVSLCVEFFVLLLDGCIVRGATSHKAQQLAGLLLIRSYIHVAIHVPHPQQQLLKCIFVLPAASQHEAQQVLDPLSVAVIATANLGAQPLPAAPQT